MKLTNGEIFNAKEPLDKLLQEKLPVKTSYPLVKLAKALGGQLEVINKVRKGLFETYGELDEATRQLKIDPQSEGFPKFASEMGELMSQEVEIVIEKVVLPDTLEVEPATLMMLDRFITVA